MLLASMRSIQAAAEAMANILSCLPVTLVELSCEGKMCRVLTSARVLMLSPLEDGLRLLPGTGHASEGAVTAHFGHNRGRS